MIAVLNDIFPISKKLSGLFKMGPVTVTKYWGHSKSFFVIQHVKMFTTCTGCAPRDNLFFSREFCLNMGNLSIQRKIGTLCTRRGAYSKLHPLFVCVPLFCSHRQFHRWWYWVQGKIQTPIGNLQLPPFALL